MKRTDYIMMHHVEEMACEPIIVLEKDDLATSLG
jgi:hypothetical protein